jgi:hypothetical protein
MVLTPAKINTPPAIYLKYLPKYPNVPIEKNTTAIPVRINIGINRPDSLLPAI